MIDGYMVGIFIYGAENEMDDRERPGLRNEPCICIYGMYAYVLRMRWMIEKDQGFVTNHQCLTNPLLPYRNAPPSKIPSKTHR